MVIGNPRCVPRRPKPGSMGLPLPGYAVALCDEAGEEGPADAPGVIAVRRNPWSLRSGYWNMEAEWNARWQDDWIVTGDTRALLRRRAAEESAARGQEGP